MVLRPFRSLWRPLLNTATTFVHFAWHSVTDFLDQEPVVGNEKVVKRIVETVIIDAGSPEDWNMMNDEIL
jgi:hypothetical protein